MLKKCKPIDIPHDEEIVRFWDKVEKTKACWLWTGLLRSGYGMFQSNGNSYVAHRLSFRILVGTIPLDKYLDHICRVRRCVNPSHLRVVTHKENVLCGIGPTAINAHKTRCIHGHEFTKQNTYIRKPGWRICRTCRNLDHQRKHYKIRRRMKNWNFCSRPSKRQEAKGA